VFLIYFQRTLISTPTGQISVKFARLVLGRTVTVDERSEVFSFAILKDATNVCWLLPHNYFRYVISPKQHEIGL